MLNLDYPQLLGLFQEHLDPRRTESAAFLIWYLENYYRLDTLDAIDSVCDQNGDKGIDGIYVNDNESTITIFQSKIAQNSASTIGDKALREFAGTLTQFADATAIQNLIDTGGDAEVVRLVKRLDLVNRVQTHDVIGVFVCNIEADANGKAFLAAHPGINFLGKSKLQSTYISDKRDRPIQTQVSFDITGFTPSEYTVDANTKTVICPIRARELIGLSGIPDQSLFAFNVRGPLGGTKVNRDIVSSIQNPATHKQFPLFHNGITIICGSLQKDANSIAIDNYYVVNGCQSLSALYDNERYVTNNLYVMVKFIHMDVNSALSAIITRYSNNQNGVKARDFKANHPIQIRLQNEFKTNYAGTYAYEIKRGEEPVEVKVISNETAGLYLMAFDLEEPWATHRKYQVFDDKHSDLFGRPEVTADRIVMCDVILEAIKECISGIHNTLFAKYVLTQYTLLYIVRQILENDALHADLFQRPEKFVRDVSDRDHFKKCIKRIVGDIVVDLNAEIDPLGSDFDYRGKLRDHEWVKNMAKTIVSGYLKLVNRGRIAKFADEWAAYYKEEEFGSAKRGVVVIK